jgi:hypothetical protein
MVASNHAKQTRKAKTKKPFSWNAVVHQGKRLAFTDEEINRAWKRANKHSGLGVS